MDFMGDEAIGYALLKRMHWFHEKLTDRKMIGVPMLDEFDAELGVWQLAAELTRVWATMVASRRTAHYDGNGTMTGEE